MTIIDTSVMVSLLKGTHESIKNIKTLQDKNQQISTTIITAYELLKGAQLSLRRQENLALVKNNLKH